MISVNKLYTTFIRKLVLQIVNLIIFSKDLRTGLVSNEFEIGLFSVQAMCVGSNIIAQANTVKLERQNKKKITQSLYYSR